MDFFARQDKARRNTRVLGVYFALAVIGIVLAVYAVFAATLLRSEHQREQRRLTVLERRGFTITPAPAAWWWNGELFLWVATGTAGVIFLGSLIKTAELARGGSVVATMLGGRPVNPDTQDLQERKFLNVVEEMSIASGVPAPQAYVLDEERGINAFAAGHSTKDAVIGVTRGALRHLKRDELQGVIAHEFSHLLNGDMRLNLRLMGLVFGILMIATIGRILLRTARYGGSRGGKKGGNPLPLIGLALFVIGWIGVFFGHLIKSAVSRQREYLADAAAVQFTRNPGGLASALKKIGGLATGSRIENAHASEASHLFFSQALAESWLQFMSTHPPLVERIKLLDPAFDGTFPATAEAEMAEETSDEATAAGLIPPPLPLAAAPPVMPPQLMDLLGGRSAAPGPATAMRPAEIATRVGNVQPQHLVFAGALKEAFPAPLVQAAHEPLGAAALLCSLLLSRDGAARGLEQEHLRQLAGDAVATETARLLPWVDAMPREVRLPLALLSLPALRGLARSQYDQIAGAIRALIESDQQIDLFEFALTKMLQRHLEPQFHRSVGSSAQYYSLRPLTQECAVLLSALARFGQDDEPGVATAFAAGAAELAATVGRLPLLEAHQCGLGQIDQALDRLAVVLPALKKPVIDACAHTVGCDGTIRREEAELLRAIADAIDCPIPPFLQGV